MGRFQLSCRERTNGDVQTTIDDRIAWEEPSTSFVAVFALGLILSILVYFSPCAFPVLPGFISYYLSLGAREDELIKEGKLKTAMPSSWVIGILAGLGMWTFFIIIGIIAFAMGEAFAQSGMIHYHCDWNCGPLGHSRFNDAHWNYFPRSWLCSEIGRPLVHD